MSEHILNVIKEDVKEIKEEVKDLTKQGAANTMNLALHMQRTEASEKRIEKLEKWLMGILTAVLLSVLSLVVRNFML